MTAPSLRSRLDALVADVDVPARLAADPVGLVRAFKAPDDLEVAGLLAATLAFGNVVAIRRSVARALAALGESPAAAVDTLDERALRARLRGFVHRVWTG